MPVISLPVDGEQPYGVKLRTAINAVNTVVDSNTTRITAAENDIVDIEGAWLAYTPTWTSTGTQPTLGNGQLTGVYKKVGRTVHFRVGFVYGSTSTSGTGVWRFSIPVAAADGATVFSTFITDSGSRYYVDCAATVALGGSLSAFSILTGGGLTSVQAGVPMVWAASDEIVVTGTYRSAS